MLYWFNSWCHRNSSKKKTPKKIFSAKKNPKNPSKIKNKYLGVKHNQRRASNSISKYSNESISQFFNIRVSIFKFSTFLVSTWWESVSCKCGSGTDCAECVAQSSRTQDNHCSTCNPGYYISGNCCVGMPLYWWIHAHTWGNILKMI